MFTPTPASTPPPNAVLRLKYSSKLPVNITPLEMLVPLQAILCLTLPRAQRVQNLAYALKRVHGIKPGDRVAVIAPNWAVITPINTRLTVPEVDYILEHSGAKLVLVDYEYTKFVEGKKIPYVVSARRDGRALKWSLMRMQMPVYVIRKWLGDDTRYASLTFSTKFGNYWTSSYLAAIANAYEARITRDSTYLWILPMFHACGWTYPWANVFAFATQIGIVNAPEAQRLEHQVHAIIAGSAPTAHLIGELEKKNIHVTHVYGLTEAGWSLYAGPGPEWARLSLDERAKFMARQGQAFATADEARVVYTDSEENLRDVPADGKTVGEIVVRGNIVMKEVISKTPRPRRKRSKVVIFGLEILQ
ncbi:AMP-dependent synthetase and ligase [Rhizoctonia solani AG-1 IA]|uniref:AMP-dependent synthetase and ligase n=1 Tax=Thanatephorus cucumeris (strain AG1-IA) TaxID=983506 RepID=L8WYE7_THACA|nr:AMP-dependent synthetase and ligase [Rhizoctonia solani AG-1 IA]